MERLAAEEYEKERVRVSRTRPELDLTFEPSEAWPSSSRSSTPSSFASQEEAETELETETPTIAYTPSETGKSNENTRETVTLCVLLTNNVFLKSVQPTQFPTALISLRYNCSMLDVFCLSV